MYLRPSRLSNPPQLGVLTGSPNPRKLREASAIITVPMVMLKMMMAGGKILGSTWRIRILHWEQPNALAASKYTFSLTPITAPRMTRELLMPPVTPRTTMICKHPLAHDGHDGQQEEQSRERHPGVDKTLVPSGPIARQCIRKGHRSGAPRSHPHWSRPHRPVRKSAPRKCCGSRSLGPHGRFPGDARLRSPGAGSRRLVHHSDKAPAHRQRH